MQEEQQNNNNHTCNGWCWSCNTKGGAIGWGVVFLVVGLYFIAEGLGLISTGIPLWPVLLGVYGGYLLVRGLRK